ncbi:serine hydrolase domain-containing protein [Streptomyces sp. YU58]|uniref:serine hydrolase domain-containing protein n=1 Tax=Streptomyces sp. SX92 TaxID=3158972 RepID=UPI0027BA75C3|nr:serine hydrolase domain-containing protein [Streptomyces coralus]WLW57114.1 serine hydrolase domain-containing protein [Streptomyces coralus]
MKTLHDTLHRYVDAGKVPGAVALVARGDDVQVVTAGSVDVEGTAPMARDSIFRIASITKPITAAAVLMLVDEGRLALDEPVERWLPEVARPSVVRAPEAPVDDVVPADRPITVEDLLSFRAGWGFPDDFSLPAVQSLFTVQKDGRFPQDWPDHDTWLGLLAQVPMVSQPGQAWLYGTSSDLQGILVARVSGRTLPDFLAERIFEPLGMKDTAFEVPEAKRHRFTSAYAPSPDGSPQLADAPDGQWSRMPRFHSGGGGLVSTADDWLSFARLLLNAGEADGRRLLTPASVTRMITNHLTAGQRAAATLFLEGQGWGYGGQVDVTASAPWTVPGRYGWVGGTGTTAHLVPSTGTVAILMTQMAMESPTPTPLMRDFWSAVAAS